MTVVPLHPYERDLVDSEQLQKLLPKIRIERGGLVGFFPVSAPPASRPALLQGVNDVFGVGLYP